MSKNYIELAGAVTTFRQLTEKLEAEIRDGTLQGIGEAAKKLEIKAQDVGYAVNDLMFPR